MLDKHLIVKTSPVANAKNVILWKDYRITVLQDGLFRMEKSANGKFRDDATQSVWYRDMPAQEYALSENGTELVIATRRAKLLVRENRGDCEVELSDGRRQKANNVGNLKGTYRTLDACNGTWYSWGGKEYRIKLGEGVCSKTGVAVFDDSRSLTLAQDGEVKAERADGTDEYVFAYGNDFREAVQALYTITGNTPLVPRFAMGNWWSRYYIYTQDEYMRILQRFEDREVPLSVATIDMDWHWSTTLDRDKKITESGKNTPFYGGNNGWTGYSWNTELFPDYKGFLKEIEEKGLKITLNLHPADGVRWWEDMYENMANALGRDASTGEQIAFDIADTRFINAYFSVLHKPYEKDGVNFWWIDWQQGTQSNLSGLDPLWSLNHYHYLDNGLTCRTPLVLSRYAGVGSHRYPLGFSGDTHTTWTTLRYLPYFTATASNVGYTWWSHDIGGHMVGEKNDELYVRHVQFGVLSPINRLHSSNARTVTKEPWEYKNGTGEIVQEWLRLRHRLLPFLYSASYRTHKEGIALVEPLYYEWDQPQAYKYRNEYLFGGQLLVAPVTTKRQADGFARTRVWIPEGEWTDIFTGDHYSVQEGGVEKTLLRTLDSVPVLIRAGGILPLSQDKGNGAKNPQKLEISVWNGNGEYTLFEDGREEGSEAELHTIFRSEYMETTGAGMQSLYIRAEGNADVVPEARTLRVVFKEAGPTAKVCVKKNGEIVKTKKLYADYAATEFVFDADAEYEVSVEIPQMTRLQKLIARALKLLVIAEAGTIAKERLWKLLREAKTVEEFVAIVEENKDISKAVKSRLTETL